MNGNAFFSLMKIDSKKSRSGPIWACRMLLASLDFNIIKHFFVKIKISKKFPFGAFRGPAGCSSLCSEENLTKRYFPILTFYEKFFVHTSKILRNDAGNDFSITLYTLQKLRRNLLQSIKKNR